MLPCLGMCLDEAFRRIRMSRLAHEEANNPGFDDLPEISGIPRPFFLGKLGGGVKESRDCA